MQICAMFVYSLYRLSYAVCGEISMRQDSGGKYIYITHTHTGIETKDHQPQNGNELTNVLLYIIYLVAYYTILGVTHIVHF